MTTDLNVRVRVVAFVGEEPAELFAVGDNEVHDGALDFFRLQQHAFLIASHDD